MHVSDSRELVDEARAALAEHLARINSLMLATVGADGMPHASYAPFVRDADGALCIFVSDLSEHTGNLRRCPNASLLLIEDEQDAREPFARRRLSLRARASIIPRDDERWEGLADAFQQRFGRIVEVFRGLGDFRLVRLEPTGGSFVMGFGRAFELAGTRLDKLAHIDEAAVQRRVGEKPAP
ncbi:MAG: pyridoxamine 5'-phosphate oxidase family protein [Thiohalocapsa sp.]|uniref:HugZ family pyridoxamine 5'-phosphate oxidase n=1 Tax=Thiohalocapsa sp. TaxID=2497641 RepID=UPI0025DB457C|nr:pyridoxamine 5'-phosphate oxidase family protein [Thiohalocapsa sp.]MCG6939851.1 pyridoxamine 5'-phosphate oxidase family protein [Thiohalocapsa sp.]